MLVNLEKAKDVGRHGGIPWVSCKPFVENKAAVLVHRVRHVTTYKIGPKYAAHIGVKVWCGNTMTGRDKFTFLDSPTPGRLVCARCERAVAVAGLPTSDELAGEHVHLGGLVAKQLCCKPFTNLET